MNASAMKYLKSLFYDNRMVELRALNLGNAPRWKWHDDPHDLIKTARQWAGEGVLLATTMAQPICTTAIPDTSLKDSDVAGYGRLLFDFDRKEKSGQGASDDELAEAEGLRNQFVAYMDSMGWPAPALATSGNGMHALYRVAVTPTPEMHSSLGRMYRVLSDTFQSARFKLDTTTYNAAQLCRLYGSLNRKYPAVDGRPQRMASIVLPPDWMDTNFMCRDVIDQYPPPPKPRLVVSNAPPRHHHADWRTLDIVGWFRAKGLYIAPLTGGKHAVTCPWQAQGVHEKSSYSDTVVWETSRTGYPTFLCSHDSCSGRGSLVDLGRELGDIASFCGGRAHG